MTSPAEKTEPLKPSARNYLKDHWAGRHSLAVSFWINLVALRLAVIAVEAFVITPFAEGSLAGLIATITYLVFAHIALFVWQVRGLLQACDRYQTSYGSMSVVLGVHLGIVLSLFFTVVSSFTTFQNSFIVRDDTRLFLIWEEERAAKYAIDLLDDGTRIRLAGSFELGVTKKLRALLERHPDATLLELASPGGNTYEGRGIAKLVLTYGLDTQVDADCFSACTLAFMAGKRRLLGPNGRLGFHQYGLDADYEVPFLDIAAEQEIDRSFFLERGISDDFLEKVFSAGHREIWVPERPELLEAGVIHGELGVAP